MPPATWRWWWRWRDAAPGPPLHAHIAQPLRRPSSRHRRALSSLKTPPPIAPIAPRTRSCPPQPSSRCSRAPPAAALPTITSPQAACAAPLAAQQAPPPPPPSWTACAYVAVGLEVHVCVVNAVLGQHGLDGCKKGQEGECKLAQVRRRARAVRSCCSPPQTLGRGAPSRSSLGFCTVDVKLMPPLSFFRNVISGGFLFSRMPKPASHTAKCVRVQPRGRLQPRPAAPLRAAGSPSLTLTLKLVLDQLLVRQRLEAVQHD